MGFDRAKELLDGFMPECGWLDDTETLTYLHSTVSTKRHRVRVPETPVYLDALRADLESFLRHRDGRRPVKARSPRP